MDINTLISFKDFVTTNPGLVIGFVLPPLIDVLNKDIPADRETERTLATLTVCFAVAFLFNFNKVMLNSWTNIGISFPIIFTESYGVYKLYFKNSFLRSKLLEKLYGVPVSLSASPSPSPSLAIPSSEAVG